MKFTTAEAVEQVVWQMKLADLPRGQDRSLVQNLFEGMPPYSQTEVDENDIQTNVNFLEASKIAHDARRQFSNAFTKPGVYFNVSLDSGPIHKRGDWSTTITKKLGKLMKQRRGYYETLRSTFATLVLNGIGPSIWDDRQGWVPRALSIDEVMIPSGTLISMENLQHFAVYRQYTPAQLYKATHGPKVDCGWNMKMADKAIEWAFEQAQGQTNYNTTWFPEKVSEIFKSDSGYFATDAVPTIDCWDFYFWNDEGKKAGWNRRIVMDSPSDIASTKGAKSILDTSGEFLYDSGSRVYAEKLDEIIHFTFADTSSKAPFKYHSVRALGWLLYAVCHLNNRLRCRLNDATFEALMQYFRAANPDDAERVMKINLVNKGIIPEGLEFVKAADRWSYNESLAQSTLNSNRQSMADNSTSFTQDFNFGSEESAKTATEVIAKVNSSAALVSSMLNQAYEYQKFQYYEVCRRFCQKNSKDPDVRKFRVEALKSGIPEEMLNAERWDIEPDRVLGGGNKTLEIAQSDRLMAVRNLLDPEAQRLVLHDYVLATTDDPSRAERLAPVGKPRFSNATYEAQLALGTLMLGLPVSVKPGINHIEYVEALLAGMAAMMQRIEATGGTAEQHEIVGLQNVGQHISQHISIIAQDENEQQRVKVYGDDLGNLMNMVKAYAQRAAEEQQKQNQNGLPPEAMSKIMTDKTIADAKAANMRESHAQRTAQRQVQWEMEQQRKGEGHNADMVQKGRLTAADIAAKDAETAAQITRQGTKETNDNSTEG